MAGVLVLSSTYVEIIKSIATHFPFLGFEGAFPLGLHFRLASEVSAPNGAGSKGALRTSSNR